MSVKVEESGAFEAFWDTLSFSVNGIVFFYSGAACINFFVRRAVLTVTTMAVSEKTRRIAFSILEKLESLTSLLALRLTAGFAVPYFHASKTCL